jgi:hypothetical protein
VRICACGAACVPRLDARRFRSWATLGATPRWSARKLRRFRNLEDIDGRAAGAVQSCGRRAPRPGVELPSTPSRRDSIRTIVQPSRCGTGRL